MDKELAIAEAEYNRRVRVLSRRVKRMESICQAVYVGLGANFNLPERWLDVLCEPCDATDAQIEALLPMTEADCVELSQVFVAAPAATENCGPSGDFVREGEVWEVQDTHQRYPSKLRIIRRLA